MSLSFFEDLEGVISDLQSDFDTVTTAASTPSATGPKDLLASIEYTWRGAEHGLESARLSEAIAEFGGNSSADIMSCLDDQAEVKLEDFDVPSPDSGIGACYDLDSNALLCGPTDPVLGLPFDAELFEASTSTAATPVNGVDTDDNYSMGATATAASEDDNKEILLPELPDSFMDISAADPVAAEKAIKEAPVIIFDVTPIDVGEATALTEQPAAEKDESGGGIKFSNSIHTYAGTPPSTRRRRRGGSRSFGGAAAKVVVRVKPFAVVPPSTTDETSSRVSPPGTSSSRKRKLYEMGPLDNPEEERCRLNALNAKKNREKKKRQLTEAAMEIERLREENSELRSEAELVRDELEQARLELATLRAQLKADSSLGNKKWQQRQRV